MLLISAFDLILASLPLCPNLLLGQAPGPREMPPSCSSTPPTPRRPRSRISLAPGPMRGPRGGVASKSRSEVSRSSFSSFPSSRPWADKPDGAECGAQWWSRARTSLGPRPATPHPSNSPEAGRL